MSGKRCAEEEPVAGLRYTRIKLASPSPERSGGSDTESIRSCQGYETELVKDTSDTSTSSPTYDIEYEITEVADEKNKIYLSDDSDDSEDVSEIDKAFVMTNESSLDVAMLGDTSEENSTSPTSNSDVDPGLPRSDYLDFENCLLCQTNEKDISYPYCSSCFTWKKNLFPCRPKKLQKIVKKDRTQGNDLTKCSDTSNVENTRIVSTEIENSTENEHLGRDSNLSEGCSQDSGVGSSEPQISEDVVDKPSSEPSTSMPSTSNHRKLSLDMCRVCFIKPENGLFVHSTKAHLYGCYNCAKKIWYYNGGCPICRRKIFKVAKLFV